MNCHAGKGVRMLAANEPHRRLAAILSADAVGYSRLMQADTITE